jgi:hypothetical protein
VRWKEEIEETKGIGNEGRGGERGRWEKQERGDVQSLSWYHSSVIKMILNVPVSLTASSHFHLCLSNVASEPEGHMEGWGSDYVTIKKQNWRVGSAVQRVIILRQGL